MKHPMCETEWEILKELNDGTLKWGMVEVVELDTKSKSATKEFTPTLKFVTEKIS